MDRNAVGQHAIQVNVGIHEPGRNDVPCPINDRIVAMRSDEVRAEPRLGNNRTFNANRTVFKRTTIGGDYQPIADDDRSARHA